MGRWKIGHGSWALAVVPLLLIGCAQGTGDVSGKVTFNGEPLPGGLVTFIAENGKAYTTRIGEDGSFTISGVPEGLARITIATAAPVKFGGGKTFEPLGKYVAIPPRYKDPENSGFSLPVKRGPQKYDLALMP